MTPSADLQEFIDRHVTAIEPLARAAALAEWDLETTGSDADQARCEALRIALYKIYASGEDFQRLRSIDVDAIGDPLLRRQYTLLHNAYAGQQMAPAALEAIAALEVEVQGAFNTYRPELRGRPVTDNEIAEILDRSPDVALRRDAWEASKEVGAHVAERVRALACLRNREARRLGYGSYYAMALELEEIDEAWLLDLLERLRSQTTALWDAFKQSLDQRLAARFGTTPDQIRPWHHANPFFQEPGRGDGGLDRFFEGSDLAPITAAFFGAIGLPIEPLLSRSDLFERPGKSQHAFCIAVDRSGDVRVLCNVRPDERWMGTMLHEFGHAVYDYNIDRSLPYLLREPAHTFATEAVAIYMGRLSKDPSWLRCYAAVSDSGAADVAAEAREQTRQQLLMFTRWCLVMVHFERALYADPDQDLDGLWWDLVERYQQVRRPDGRSAPDWAAKIHLATTPAYYHNYQLGEIVASQLKRAVEAWLAPEEGPDARVVSPRVGAYFTNRVFGSGASLRWDAWIERAAGEPLAVSYFAQDLQPAA